MKTARNKLPAQKALLLATAAPMVPNVAPEVDADEDEDQLVRTSDAAHKLRVTENTVRKYVQLGIVGIACGSGRGRCAPRAAAWRRLMGQQAAE